MLLSLVTPTEELKKMIEAEGLKEGAHIQASDRMEARLSGSNFAITAVTPEVQAVSRGEPTEWKWDIKPVSEGKQYLHLTLSTLINVDGASTPRAIRSFDKTIEVEVSWRQKTFLFIERNWQLFWRILLLPTGRRRRANARFRAGPRQSKALALTDFVGRWIKSDFIEPRTLAPANGSLGKPKRGQGL